MDAGAAVRSEFKVLIFPVLSDTILPDIKDESNMNEVAELSKLDVKNLPPIKPILLDDLNVMVQKNLYLEIGSGPYLFLLSPSYSILNPRPEDDINDFVGKNEVLLDYLKETIIQNLAVYSVLIDINSYFIEQNNGVVLARLKDRDSGGRRFEIKFYTHAAMELLKHYEDKIYIGRDFIDLFNFRRRHFGLKDLIVSLRDQYDDLIDTAQQKLKSLMEHKSFFQEISESVSELKAESLQILETIPPHLDFSKISGTELIDINAQYRAINHYLIELQDEVGEFENLLRYKKENDFVRYVTKYRKDLTNLISYFNIKINGFLSAKIHNFKNREK